MRTTDTERIARDRPRRCLVALALATVVLSGCRQRSDAGGDAAPSARPSASAVGERRAPAGDAELALLAPLHEGSSLEDYEVTRIYAVQGGTLRIVCKQRDATVRLDVALAADGAPPPPAHTERFAIYYSVRSAPPADGERLAIALAKVLEANASAAAPAGLTPFVPGERGIEL